MMPARDSRSGFARRWGVAALAAVAPVLLAVLLSMVLLWATRQHPLEVFGLLTFEAFGDMRRIASTLAAATPLMLTGLATAVAFRTGVFNVGVEGCLYVGGLAAAVTGFGAAGVLPPASLLPVALLASLLAGAGWMWLPGVLRARLAVDEVVTTLMLNFVAIQLALWLVNGPLLAPGSANSATPLVVAHARLPSLMSSSSLNAGFLLALALLLLYGLWGRRSVLGFETRMTGLNARFAGATGIDVPGLVLRMMLVSGAIGGLAGGIHALGTVGRFVGGFSPGYGFTGIAVALLGRGSAGGMLLAAVLFGALATAGATVQLFSDVPIAFVDVLQGLVMVFAVLRFSPALDRLRSRLVQGRRGVR